MPNTTLEQFRAYRISGKPTDKHVIDAWVASGLDDQGPSEIGNVSKAFLYPVTTRIAGVASTVYYTILKTQEEDGFWFEYRWIHPCIERERTLEHAERELYAFLLNEGCFETSEETLRRQYREAEAA